MRHQASIRLYSGDVTDFREAMKLCEAQCNEEIRWLGRQIGRPGRDRELDMTDLGRLEHSRANARQALAVYDKYVNEAERRAVEELKTRGLGSDFYCFARCLENGDYTELAL